MKTDYPSWLLPSNPEFSGVVHSNNLFGVHRSKRAVSYMGVSYSSIKECARAIGKSTHYVTARADDSFDDFRWID